MVAAAGTTSALKPLAGASAGLALARSDCWSSSVGFADRALVTSLVPLPKPPMLLVERAKEILATVGYPPGDRLGARVRAGQLPRLPRRSTRSWSRPSGCGSGEPATLHFWYRGSPTVMVPTGDADSVTQNRSRR